MTLLQNRGLSPRKISTSHGGEFCSPCPVCGDGGKGLKSDRFHVWPNRETGGKAVGKYWCRQCDISGDTIAFLQQVDGLTFPQACAELGIGLDQMGGSRRSRYQAPPKKVEPSYQWTPTTYATPGPVWRQKAENLLADCQHRLIGDGEAMAWLEGRGINADIAIAYGLGYNRSSKGKDRYRPRTLWGLPSKMQVNKEKRLWLPQGWVIPSRNQVGELIQLRIRRRNQDIAAFADNIKYLPVEGSSMATMILHPQAEVFVVVESGFDAILLAGLTGGRIGAVTTWNDAARPDIFAHRLLSQASCILGGLDYDHGGDNQQQWWQGQYRQYRRLAPLPGGAKDPGDAAKDGADLYAWLVDGLPRGLQIKLGFVGKRMSAVRHAQPPARPIDPPKPEEQTPDVVEIELALGKVVYVTNNQQVWQDLAGQGKPVFSQNELERLKVALAGMDQQERDTAIIQAIELKEVFGGYIMDGRGAFQEGEYGESV